MVMVFVNDQEILAVKRSEGATQDLTKVCYSDIVFKQEKLDKHFATLKDSQEDTMGSDWSLNSFRRWNLRKVCKYRSN